MPLSVPKDADDGGNAHHAMISLDAASSSMEVEKSKPLSSTSIEAFIANVPSGDMRFISV